MLRRKHRVGNLKQEREKIARYLQSFFSQVRGPDPDPERRDPGKGDDAASKDATISDNQEAGKDAKDKLLAKADTSVVIGLVALEKPGPSRDRSLDPKKNSDRGSRKTTRDKSTEMRKNLSTQSLRRNEEVDDAGNDGEFHRRDEPQMPKYILVGWDPFRSKMMLLLMILFLLWISIYFPLIGS
nr:uncharacterized protein LOC117223350 isoform X1 [Megalopta genalis]